MYNKKDYVAQILKTLFIICNFYIGVIALIYIKKEICGIPTFMIYLFSIIIVVVLAVITNRKRIKIENSVLIRHENICLLSVSIVLLMLQLLIVWNAIFRTAWDPGAVWYGAHYVSTNDQAGIESMAYYFSVYPNNLLLVYIYSIILRLNDLIGQPISNGTLLLSIFQCFLITFTGVIFFKVAKRVVGNYLAWIGYFFFFVLVGLSGWIMIPYSDSTGVIFPITILYLYLLIKESSNTKRKCFGIFGILFLSYSGFHIKPMVLIVLIAIVLIEVSNIVTFWKKYNMICGKKYLKYSISGILGLVTAMILVNISVKSMEFPVVTETVLGWQHHMMLGLNKDTNGGYSQEDFDYSTSFTTSEEQHAAEYAEIKQRLEDFGVLGYMEHFVKKSARNYFDASFGWGGLGDLFYTEIFQQRDNKLCPIIRSLYYDNNDENLYKYNLLFRQIIWYIVICSMQFAAWSRGELDTKNKVLLLSVLGLMIYLQIFEAHARYVFTFVPLYIITACLGMRNLVHKMENK